MNQLLALFRNALHALFLRSLFEKWAVCKWFQFFITHSYKIQFFPIYRLWSRWKRIRLEMGSPCNPVHGPGSFGPYRVFHGGPRERLVFKFIKICTENSLKIKLLFRPGRRRPFDSEHQPIDRSQGFGQKQKLPLVIVWIHLRHIYRYSVSHM